ncbi:MAG: LacI family transcriptional regulator [Spirochaetae bacterium HGW-Spirochaetae-5]|nr:MAG: LacI family transcriptional regulator [Spirochaetae bacterium HGW-Spirochaetae-5]
MNGMNEDKLSRGTDLPFNEYLHKIIHEWSITLSALAFILVPLFFILDYFTMPQHLLPKFAAYRLIATVVPLTQYFIIKKTSPGMLSHIHGYLVSLVVGGVIAVMTVDLGGFDSSYYAGINLVIIGVNLLLPWKAYHSAVNGIMLILFYVIINFLFPNPYRIENLINNLYFMSGTVIIAVSINYVRHKLIKQEFYLRSELRKARDALWGEMELAKKIQTTLLPENGRLGEYQIAAVMRPADEVGGDYYDFFETDSGEKWVTIGDVSGHGVDSGLIMMMTQTSIFSILNRTPGYTPSKMLSSINSVIRKNIQRLDMKRYMTLIALKLAEGKVTVAGKHQDIVIMRCRGEVEILPTSGTWIGIADDIGSVMKNHEIKISKGDMILLYTDGASEASDKNGELFGDERIINSFKANSSLPINEIIQNILNDINAYQVKQDDDITIMVIKKIL